jgi:dolichol-phosphate mannosyltransferase
VLARLTNYRLKQEPTISIDPFVREFLELKNEVPTIVFLPALNEEEGIGLTISELKDNLRSFQEPRFLVIDGNSRDRTAEVARSMGAEVLTQDGIGKGNAIDCGIRHIQEDVRYVIMTDADHTYPAEYIPKMIEVLESDPNIGMVCGNRFNSKLPYESGGYRFYIGNKVLAGLHRLMNGVTLNDPLTGLRVIRWAAVKDWRPKSKGFDIEVELNDFIQRSQYRIREIDIQYRERLGSKKLKVRHGFSILERILERAFS